MVTISCQDILLSRGLMQAASDANWQPHEYRGQHGWRYPIYNSKGEQFTLNAERVYRWKNADSNGSPKYAWLPGKPDKARYYLLPGTLDAIKAEYGACFLASGEPDVLAYRAAGRCNVICWFDGEASIPPTLADDLTIMGVTRLTYAPDRDNTGMKSAALVFNALKDTDIGLRVVRLPADMGSKFDINRLWQQVNFNKDKFDLALIDAPDIDPVDLYLYNQTDQPAAPSLPPALSTELPQAFKDVILADVESLEGFKRWNGDGWSNNVKCPFHEDAHASAGYNRDSHSFKCFVCGDMSAKDYGERRGIHLRDYFPKDTPLPNSTKPALSTNGKQETAPVVSDVPLYRDSYDVTLELIAELEGKQMPDSEPMLFPFSILHRFEGFAEIMWPGKLVYISGISGGGKTSYGEFMYETMNRNGDDCVWFGPEWDASQMKMRALQRDGGLNMSTIGKLRLYRLDEKAGVPEAERRGNWIADGAIQESIHKLRNMLAWPGRTYYLTADQRLASMSNILDAIEAVVTTKRAAGRRVRTLYFDYLQRAPKGGGIRGWDWQEMVVSQIKSLCERLELIGIVFIQPTKGESKKTRDGESLTEASGQGISDQQCNLYLTISPAFENGAKLNYARVKVVKNSLGRTDELFQVWNANRLLWFDKEAKIERHDLRKIVFGDESEAD